MNKIILITIILLAFLLRFYQLASFPSGFHIDEATLGYNSFLILNTGKDENGTFLPLYSQSFGLDRALGNFLLTALSIKIFNLSEFAVRLPFAFLGLATVSIFYIFAQEIYPRKLFALIATFLLSVSPWHIDIVRASSEASVSLFLILFGQLMFLKALKNRKFLFLLISIISMFLSIFFYHAALGFLVLATFITSVLFSISIKESKLRKNILVSSFILMISLTSFFIVGKGGANRLSQVGFHKDNNVINEQNKMFYEEGSNNTIQARLYHNKIITYSRAFIRNYFQYFSPNYLLLDGGLPPRYTPPTVGIIYFVELLFLTIGIIKILTSNIVNLKYILYLFILSPVVAALTYEYSPNVQRSFFMVIYLDLLVAFGLYLFLPLFRRNRITASLVVFFLSLNMIYYLHQYYIHFPVHEPHYRNDGAKELVTEITKLKNQYPKIIISNYPESPYHYFLFYSIYDPYKYQLKYAKNRDLNTGWFYEKNIFFSPDQCPSKKDNLNEGKVLFVDGSTCSFGIEDESKYSVIKEILRKDKSVVYRILERKIQ